MTDKFSSFVNDLSQADAANTITELGAMLGEAWAHAEETDVRQHFEDAQTEVSHTTHKILLAILVFSKQLRKDISDENTTD